MRVWLPAIVCLLSNRTAFAEKTAAEQLEAVQGYYRKVTKLKADFTQEVEKPTFGTKKTSTGTMYIESTGKMRWDYEAPETQHFISDGTTLWWVEPANKQVTKMKLAGSELAAAVGFLVGKGDLEKAFSIALDPGAYGGKDDVVLKLTPKQANARVKTLWFVVDPEDHRVKESIFIETGTGNVNRLRYDNAKENPDRWDAGWFTYSNKKRYKLVVVP